MLELIEWCLVVGKAMAARAAYIYIRGTRTYCIFLWRKIAH